jgi:hypothetical protein
MTSRRRLVATQAAQPRSTSTNGRLPNAAKATPMDMIGTTSGAARTFAGSEIKERR